MGTISNRAKVGNPLPFDAIPREMATDPRLDRAKKDYFVAGRLLFYARWDDHTTVADDTIAREAGIGLATVKRSLRRLEAAGWIRRRRARKTRENATGRVIVLCWKLPDFAESRKAPADGTSAGRISGGVAHQCANESLSRERLESLTSARQHRVVVVEGVENKTPLTPQSFNDNDNDPDPDPAVIPLPFAADDAGPRAMVEDLGGSLADAIDQAEPVDEDAEAAEPAPRVYPMVAERVKAEGFIAARAKANQSAMGGPLRLISDEVEEHVDTAPGRTLLQDLAKASPVNTREDKPTFAAVSTETEIISLSVSHPPGAEAETEIISDSPAPAPAAADAYSPSQLAWLASLTEAQRARFAELSPGRKREVITPHTHRLCDDPAHRSETARALAPRPGFAVERAMPTTLEGLWAALPGAPVTWPQLAAEMMCRHFGAAEDRKLWPAFHALALAAWRGQFSPDGVLDALRQANKPAVRNRGAVFNTALQRDHGWRW